VRSILILVKPNAKSNSIGKSDQGQIWICVAAPATEGMANEKVILFLSKALDLPKSCVKIASGHTSRLKRIEFTCENESKIDAYFDGLDQEKTLK